MSKKLQSLTPEQINKAMFMAVKNWQTKKLIALINQGGNINIQDEDGNSLLIYAAKNKSAHMCSLLIELGVDPLITNKEGRNFFDYGNTEEKPVLGLLNRLFEYLHIIVEKLVQQQEQIALLEQQIEQISGDKDVVATGAQEKLYYYSPW